MLGVNRPRTAPTPGEELRKQNALETAKFAEELEGRAAELHDLAERARANRHHILEEAAGRSADHLSEVADLLEAVSEAKSPADLPDSPTPIPDPRSLHYAAAAWEDLNPEYREAAEQMALQRELRTKVLRELEERVHRAELETHETLEASAGRTFTASLFGLATGFAVMFGCAVVIL